MNKTVIAVDALDTRLVDKWDLDNLKLDSYQELESYSWRQDGRFRTAHIWPYIACGIEPNSKVRDTAEWSNSYLNRLSNLSSLFMPKYLRVKIGKVLEKHTNEHIPQYDLSRCVFDSIVTWPGLKNENLAEAWRLIKDVTRERMDIQDAAHDIYQTDMKNLRAARGSDGYIGVHIHYLDFAGHVYRDNIEMLKKCYIDIDKAISHFNGSLCVISDHGMRNSLYDEDKHGWHSKHGHIAVTDDWPENLPKTVLDAHSYLIQPENEGLYTEYLKELGYL